MRNIRYLIHIVIIFILIVAWSCRELENPVRSSDEDPDDQPQSELSLTGIWQGKIDGEHPYFKSNPTVNMELTQLSYVLRGIIRTSDGAFKNDTLKQGISIDSTVNFEVRQTDYYTNEILTFTGKYQSDTISGYWFNIQKDSSAWFVTRVR
jgi:hypothetical protein